MNDLTTRQLPADILALITKEVAMNFMVVPISVEDGAIRIALTDDHDDEAPDDIAFFLGKKVKVETFPPAVMAEALRKFYGISEIDLQRSKRMPAHDSKSDSDAVSVREEASQVESFQEKPELSSDGSAVAMANRLITDAIRMGASDIHIEPYEKFMRVRYRLDGVLHEMQQLGLDKSKPLISRLKIMSELDIAEKRRPQDGRIRVRQNGRTIDIRVSSLPTDFGEKVVLRILDKSQLAA